MERSAGRRAPRRGSDTARDHAAILRQRCPGKRQYRPPCHMIQDKPMGRSVPHAALIVAFLLFPATAQQASRDAVSAMQRGDFASAEKILRAETQTRPDDAWALSLLGVALDN